MLLLLVFVVLAAALKWLSRETGGAQSPAGETAPVWAGGFARSKLQGAFRPASFASPLTVLLSTPGLVQEKRAAIEGIFPQTVQRETVFEDFFLNRVYLPVFRGMRWVLLRARWMRHAGLNLYVLQIALVALILLLWGAIAK